MATSPAEMEDLSKFTGSLLVNFGTITDKEGMLEAGKIAMSSSLLATEYLLNEICSQDGGQIPRRSRLYLIPLVLERRHIADRQQMVLDTIYFRASFQFFLFRIAKRLANDRHQRKSW